MDIEVILTWAEVLTAAHVGCMRNVQSLKLGRSDTDVRVNQDGDIDFAWGSNIEGAAGEMATAKHLNLFWSGAVGNIRANDVGGYQVKTNTSRRWDDLILRRRNSPDKIYISVLSFLPRFVLTGWISGTEAMKEEYYREGTPGMPGYFFPRKLLRDMNTLPRVVDQDFP
jgi:hypothetical protein